MNSRSNFKVICEGTYYIYQRLRLVTLFSPEEKITRENEHVDDEKIIISIYPSANYFNLCYNAFEFFLLCGESLTCSQCLYIKVHIYSCRSVAAISTATVAFQHFGEPRITRIGSRYREAWVAGNSSCKSSSNGCKYQIPM